jgi:hypothetical protein
LSQQPEAVFNRESSFITPARRRRPDASAASAFAKTPPGRHWIWKTMKTSVKKEEFEVAANLYYVEVIKL